MKNTISLHEDISYITIKNDFFRVDLSGSDNPATHNVLTPYYDPGINAYNCLNNELIEEPDK